MKLYELPRESYFTIAGDMDKEVFKFSKIDGMYSICYDKMGRIIHFSASLDVFKQKELDKLEKV